MLFNSYIFICLYLPITLLVFFTLGRFNHRLAAGWLAVASLFFYAWWSPAYVFLLLGSIIFNYSVGMSLCRSFDAGRTERIGAILFLGVSINLSLLAYYKYANFMVTSFNDLWGTSYVIDKIILPIGISFFTFTQIAFLVDASRGLAKEYDFIHYCVFVTYFPHLIAGPILHHKDLMPQFARDKTYKLNYESVAVGLTLFIFGLFKKLVFADNISGYSTPVFDAASKGTVITFLEAWSGTVSYTLQLYFDFSGYSDMAIGISRMFGVNLPINFYSPYKAMSIIEFWRRWHMTLSRFLRDYLYIPLGGNRKGTSRRYINLLVTMLLGGLWHGANWTFVAWGGLHGVYLTINHLWRQLCARLGIAPSGSAPYLVLCRCITFLAIVIAWVFFRSDSIGTAFNIIKGMFGIHGFSIPLKWIDASGQNPLVTWLLANGVTVSENYTLFSGSGELRMIALLLAICWICPNTVEIFHEEGSGRQAFWRWRPSHAWTFITVVAGYFAFLSISELSEFIYFQF